MADPVVTRLRQSCDGYDCQSARPSDIPWKCDYCQAADKIEAQHAEIKRLRAELADTQRNRGVRVPWAPSLRHRTGGNETMPATADDTITRPTTTDRPQSIPPEVLHDALTEIERLKQENTDILATIPHIIKGVQNGTAGEVERLRAEVKDLRNTHRAIYALSWEIARQNPSHLKAWIDVRRMVADEEEARRG